MTTLFSSTAIPVATVAPAIVTPKKRGWLPLLTILFMFSYGLMTLLIVEQGQTIESQRVLIHELYRDSSELSAVKMQAQTEKNRAAQRGQNQAPAAKSPAPSVKTPSTQNPSSQAPKTPSTQVSPQHRTQGHPGRPQFKAPTRPMEDLTDEFRSLKTI